MARYTDHAGQVQQAIHNRKADRFLSIDSGAMHCWKLAGHVQARSVNTLRYPRGTYNFVTCITYSDPAKLVFCACLDGKLRIYKNDMQLKSVLAWDQTVVYDMHFLRSTNEIIATGIQGMKVFANFCLAFHVCCDQMSLKQPAAERICRSTAQKLMMMHTLAVSRTQKMYFRT